jgi:hypothetical protein
VNGQSLVEGAHFMNLRALAVRGILRSLVLEVFGFLICVFLPVGLRLMS